MGGPGIECLLVEQDPDVGALLRYHLEEFGYQVTHVRSGQAALAHLVRETPAVAVVDLPPEWCDGVRVVWNLQSLPRHHRCRVVVTSILDADDLQVDADAYLAKPFSRRDLAGALRKAGAPAVVDET